VPFDVMNVLAVTNMYPTRAHPGAGTFVKQQIDGLRNAGVNVSVLFVDRLRDGMKAYMRVPALVRQALVDARPDLVHVMYGGVLAELVTRVAHDRPSIVTYHGSDLLGGRLSSLGKRSLAAFGVTASHRAARRAAGIVVVSEVLRDKLLPRRYAAPIRVIPCGIDLNRFAPMDKAACRRELGWCEERFHVLFNAGGGDPVKRPDLARAAVARAVELGIPAELHEMSGVSNDDVPAWINASDVLVLTSLHEGSPTIVKESLACNVPVVSVEVGDVRERIAGLTGCHLALAEPGDLAAKLRLVHGRRDGIDTRSSMSCLSFENTAARVAAFYHDVLGTAAVAASHHAT
jgi:glycosyltransferase involved in cell wall biosynthesis